MAKNSSRPGASRPRRLAGSSPTPPVSEPTAEVDPIAEAEPTPAAPETTSEETRESTSDGRSIFGGRRTTRVLLAVLVVLTVAVLGEGVYLWQREDQGSAAPTGAITVSQDVFRPAVEAAAQSAQVILGADWKTYDDGIAQAKSLMTDDFAEQYVQTKADVRDTFIADHTQVEVRVLAQGVVRASDSQVQALLFFNQYVTKKGQQTSFSEYRALVTVVDTADGWLVSDIATQ